MPKPPPRSSIFRNPTPDRDAQKFILFVEGEKREKQYFEYFNIDHRIEVKVYTTKNNSPTGLYDEANNLITDTYDLDDAKIMLAEKDNVWFVIDTDEWGSQIIELKDKIATKGQWHVAESNPCFEVWLYLHSNTEIDAELATKGNCDPWKIAVNNFKSTKDALFIEDAISNARRLYKEEKDRPQPGSTQLFRLGEALMPILERKIRSARTKFNL